MSDKQADSKQKQTVAIPVINYGTGDSESDLRLRKALKNPYVASALFKGGSAIQACIRYKMISSETATDLNDLRGRISEGNGLYFLVYPETSSADIANGELAKRTRMAKESGKDISPEEKRLEYMNCKDFVQRYGGKFGDVENDTVTFVVEDCAEGLAAIKTSPLGEESHGFTERQMIPVNDLLKMQRLEGTNPNQKVSIIEILDKAQESINGLSRVNRPAYAPNNVLSALFKIRSSASALMREDIKDIMTLDREVLKAVRKTPKQQREELDKYKALKVRALQPMHPEDKSLEPATLINRWLEKSEMNLKEGVNLNSPKYINAFFNEFLGEKKTQIHPGIKAGESFSDSESLLHKKLLSYQGDDPQLLLASEMLASVKEYKKLGDFANNASKIEKIFIGNPAGLIGISAFEQISGRSSSLSGFDVNNVGKTKEQQTMIKIKEGYVANITDLKSAESRMSVFFSQNEKLATMASMPEVDFYLAQGYEIGLVTPNILDAIGVEQEDPQKGRTSLEIIRDLSRLHLDPKNLNETQASTLNNLRYQCKVGSLAGDYGMGVGLIARKYFDGDQSQAQYIYQKIKQNRKDVNAVKHTLMNDLLGKAIDLKADTPEDQRNVVGILDWKEKSGLKVITQKEFELAKEADPDRFSVVFGANMSQDSKDNKTENNLTINMPSGFNIKLDNLRVQETTSQSGHKFDGVFYGDNKSLHGGQILAWFAQHYISSAVNKMAMEMYEKGHGMPLMDVHDDNRYIMRLEDMDKFHDDIKSINVTPENLLPKGKYAEDSPFMQVFGKHATDVLFGNTLKPEQDLQSFKSQLSMKEDLKKSFSEEKALDNLKNLTQETNFESNTESNPAPF